MHDASCDFGMALSFIYKVIIRKQISEAAISPTKKCQNQVARG